MTTQITPEELLEIKSKIDKTKNRLAELKGQKESQMEILKTEFNCSTLKQAEVKKSEMESAITDLKIKIEDASEKLQNDYPLLFND